MPSPDLRHVISSPLAPTHPLNPADLSAALSPAERETIHRAAARLREKPSADTAPERIVIVGTDAAGRGAAVQALASELQRPMQRVDLSRIGGADVRQIEQALERLLAQAEQDNAILLIDEADALFGPEANRPPEAGAPVDPTVLALLRHQLDRYASPIVLGTARAPDADQLSAGQVGAVIQVGSAATTTRLPHFDSPSSLPDQRRDLNLIRSILRHTEKLPYQEGGQPLIVPGANSARVQLHLLLLLEAGYIRGTTYRSGGESTATVLVERLTWAGHDVLALLDDPHAWTDARSALLDAQGRGDFSTVLQWLRQRKAGRPPT